MWLVCVCVSVCVREVSLSVIREVERLVGNIKAFSRSPETAH